MSDSTEPAPVVLDCTIRDGSYAIDFKFTAADTALLAGLLEDAGLTYIEIGHGLGLGASEAGKGAAASHDLEVIGRTRERVSRARIGAFFIPGIGGEGDLRSAAEAGLDFVRVGQDADRVEQALPYIELARELGLEPFVNFMKSYGVAPDELAAAARRAGEAGAAAAYVVDSAGCMTPGEVAEYVIATREQSGLPVGFHGHSNLHLAVANSLSALEAGATFIDTSVYGIGRSSGNVPTEVLVAVLDRLGIESGIDLFRVIEIADSYLKPLAEHLHPHDMTAVALGYGRLHSGFLKQALDAAHTAGVNPFRAIVALGDRDPMRVSEQSLREVVTELEGRSAIPKPSYELARFSHPGFGPRRIGNRPEAAVELVDGLEIAAAKRGLRVVLDLAYSESLEEEVVTAEFVVSDDHMALGRVRFGSIAAAIDALGESAGRVGLALADSSGFEPAGFAAAVAGLGVAFPGRLVPYSSPGLELDYVGDVALALLAREGVASVALLDPGLYATGDVEALAGRLRTAVEVERMGIDEAGVATHAVVAGPLGSLGPAGKALAGSQLLFIGGEDWPQPGEPPRGWTVLRREDAYRECLPRWLRTVAAADAVAASQLVT